jgi:hypothetical protein
MYLAVHAGLGHDRAQEQVSGKAPGHEDFRVSEVDELENSVHQGVAERDQGVDAARGQSTG